MGANAPFHLRKNINPGLQTTQKGGVSAFVQRACFKGHVQSTPAKRVVHPLQMILKQMCIFKVDIAHSQNVLQCILPQKGQESRWLA